MIILEDVTVVVGTGAKKRDLLTSVRARLPSGHRIAVLARRPEDRKVFIDLLSGVVLPTAGRIIRKARVGFPPGHLGGFAPDLSVRLNVSHVARLYGAEIEATVDFVAKVSGFSENFSKPYRELSNTQRRHLSTILAFSIPFDVYLLSDELVRTGGRGYSKEASALFQARAKTSGMIIASDDSAFIREFCDMGLVLNGGQIRLFPDIERAISFFEKAPVTIPIKGKEEKRAARKRERRRQRKASKEK